MTARRRLAVVAAATFTVVTIAIEPLITLAAVAVGLFIAAAETIRDEVER